LTQQFRNQSSSLIQQLQKLGLQSTVLG